MPVQYYFVVVLLAAMIALGFWFRMTGWKKQRNK